MFSMRNGILIMRFDTMLMSILGCYARARSLCRIRQLVLLSFWGTCQVLAAVTGSPFVDAEERTAREPIKVGYAGSLTGFASSYGQAVLEGATLAAEELGRTGAALELIVEDDASDPSRILSSYQKMRSIDGIRGLIAGSWWARSIVKLAERDNVPLLSCETMYDEDFIPGRTYFIMPGYLSAWARAFEPLIEARGFKRAAIVRFDSGFGLTLEKEIQAMFSKPGRTFAGAVNYSDIQVANAASLLVRLKQLKPDVVYFDMQPSGGANLFRKLHELGMSASLVVLSHSAAYDMLEQKLIDPALLGEVYFTRRDTYAPEFIEKFKTRFGREPQLGADLGYYSLKLLYQALMTSDPVAALKSGSLQVDGRSFPFDGNNVYPGPREIVWTVRKEKTGRYLVSPF